MPDEPNINDRLIDYADLNKGENDHIKTQALDTKITQRDYDPTDNPPRWSNVDESEPALYNLSNGNGGYEYRTGVVALPLSADKDNGDTVVFARLARKTATRTIAMDVERTGEWPNIPEPIEEYTDGTADSSTGGSVITGKLIHVGEALYSNALSSDGVQQVFRIRIQYTYALSRAPTNSEPTGTVMLPNTTLTFTDTEIKRSDAYDSRLSLQRPPAQE